MLGFGWKMTMSLQEITSNIEKHIQVFDGTQWSLTLSEVFSMVAELDESRHSPP